jgi:hypothetical protein
MMRAIGLAIVVAGCSGDQRAAQSQPRKPREEREPKEPHKIIDEDDRSRGPGANAKRDAAFEATLRTNGPAVLVPMVSGPLVVLDLETSKVATHCGPKAKQIALRIGTTLADAARSEAACFIVEFDMLRCFQMEGEEGPAYDLTGAYVRDRKHLVGVLIGKGFETSYADLDAAIAVAKCP